MFRVLSCLGEDHDLRLVVLAGIVCFATSLVAVNLLRHARMTEGRSRAAWLAIAGCAAGSGIWATHFIAMLAYEPGVAVGYNVALTALSLAAAALISAIGFAIAINSDSMERAGIGGAVVGAGIASMHYIGMWALEVPGYAEWQADLVGASILLGMALGGGALMCARSDFSLRGRLLAATLLTLAIVSHHFTAMGAVEIVPDPTRTIDALSFSPVALAFIVAGLTAIILGTGVVAAIIDQRFRDKSIRLETTLDSMIQGIAMYDMQSRLVLCNRRYGEMYKLPPEVLVPGTPLVELMRQRVKAGTFDRDPETYVADVLKTVPDGRTKLVNVPDGRIMSVTNRPMPNGGWVTTHEDITQRSKAEAKVRHMARHDGLTNLPNRNAFEEQLLLAIAHDDEATHAVLCLDLDRFKTVNDTLGHAIGDGVLVAVTKRLQHALRENDGVSRFGGDEFAVVQTGIESREDAAALAHRIIDAMASPFEIDGHQVVIGTSIGIAMTPADGSDPQQLLRNADMALYRAKANGRGTFAFFEQGMDAQIQARRQLEGDLRKALANGEFELFYQPLINAVTDQVSCCEALIRWHHPTRGLVSPAEFIPLAEETGLIVPIGEWVLHTACKEAMAWPPSINLAVNLSPAQFRSRTLLQSVMNALAVSGLSAKRLEVEITESVLLHDNESTIALLHQMRTLGVRIAMDDFGTGYSSLSYLRSFPFDKIKIDRSFVKDLSDHGDCAAIVKAVAALGRGLGIATTAEGVETVEQLARVRAEGCTEAQGYLFSAPQPAPKVRAFIAARGTERSSEGRAA